MRTLGAKDGDLDFTVATGIEAVKQRIVQRVQFWRGEWFLDTRDGIPYLPSILGRRGSLGLLRQVITAHLKRIEGVVDLANVEYEYLSSERRVSFRADIVTTEGMIENLEVVTPTLPLVA